MPFPIPLPLLRPVEACLRAVTHRKAHPRLAPRSLVLSSLTTPPSISATGLISFKDSRVDIGVQLPRKRLDVFLERQENRSSHLEFGNCAMLVNILNSYATEVPGNPLCHRRYENS
jgi:hypothetical protein